MQTTLQDRVWKKLLELIKPGCCRRRPSWSCQSARPPSWSRRSLRCSSHPWTWALPSAQSEPNWYLVFWLNLIVPGFDSSEIRMMLRRLGTLSILMWLVKMVGFRLWWYAGKNYLMRVILMQLVENLFAAQGHSSAWFQLWYYLLSNIFVSFQLFWL